MAVEALVWDQLVGLNIDQDIFTASPNNTVNCVQIAAIGSGTNIGLALSPKGTGYISAQVPDGTAAGGNARGARSVDWQTARAASSQSATGARSFIGCGDSNTASGADSAVLGGLGCISSGIRSVSGGSFCTSSGTGSSAFGASCTASNTGAVATGSGCTANAVGSIATGSGGISYLAGMRAHGGPGLTFTEALQEIAIPLGGVTTTDSEVVLSLGVSGMPVLRPDSTWSGMLVITGTRSTGADVARYCRQVTIKRVANTTTLVGVVTTIGSDEASGTSINITANDTSDSLSVGVTGVASQTWRWGAVFHGVEIKHGT